MKNVTKEQVIELNGNTENVIYGEKEIERLMQEGVLISLNIGRFRGRMSISPEDLSMGEETKSLSNLGTWVLLNKDKLNELQSIELQARRIPLKFGFKTPAGYFIPLKNLADCVNAINAEKEKYFSLRDEIHGNFNVEVKEILSAYAAWARENISSNSVREEFLDKLQKAIPEREEFKNSFYFNVRQDIVILPSAKDAIYSEYLKEVRDSAYDEATRQIVSELGEEYKQRKQNELDTWISSVFDSLRAEVYDVIEDSLKAVTMQGDLSAGKVNKLRHIWEQVSRLNFHNDNSLQEGIDRINSLISAPSKGRDIESIKKNLESLSSLTKESAEKAKKFESRGNYIEL